MQSLWRYATFAGALAVAASLVFYLLGAFVTRYPEPLLAVTLFLSPAHILFMATAACEPFDRCSLSMLLWVAALNVVAYSGVALCLWYVRDSSPYVRIAAVAAAALASALWVRSWF